MYAPARAFLKCIKGHTSLSGCERCFQRGVYCNHRIIYPFEENISVNRTDSNFRMMLDSSHHNNTTPLLKIKRINIISQFSLDYMHLCCLEEMKKLLNYWVKGSISKKLDCR